MSNGIEEAENRVTDRQAAEPAAVKPEFTIRVSSDKSMVYLRLKNAAPNLQVTCEDVKDFLTKEGIVFGILEGNIREFCEKKSYYLELVAAQGIEPADGADGSLVYHFDTDLNTRPAEREDGTVDFRELGLVKNVKKGDVLAHIVPPKEGKDGTNVYGGPIPYVHGKMPAISAGSNTVLSEDNLQLTATIDGSVELKNGTVIVNEVLMISGDVDMRTGHIDCVGSVVIKGDVREGFTVKSGSNIEVYGIVEAAVLEAVGSITIRSGVNGMNSGKITAGKDITSTYIQNANIVCGGTVTSDSIMNSNISAGGNILLKGRKASLVGGAYEAGGKICSKYIGSTGYMQTNLCLKVPDFETTYELASRISPRELEYEINAGNAQLKELQALIKSKGSQMNQEGGEAVARLIVQKNKLNVKIQSMEEQKKKVLEAVEKLKQYKIVAADTIYPGCRVNLCNLYYEISQETHAVKYYIKDRAIVEEALTSEDRQW